MHRFCSSIRTSHKTCSLHATFVHWFCSTLLNFLLAKFAMSRRFEWTSMHATAVEIPTCFCSLAPQASSYNLPSSHRHSAKKMWSKITFKGFFHQVYWMKRVQHHWNQCLLWVHHNVAEYIHIVAVGPPGFARGQQQNIINAYECCCSMDKCSHCCILEETSQSNQGNRWCSNTSMY